jgi:hypothetical protein
MKAMKKIAATTVQRMIGDHASSVNHIRFTR